MTFILVWKLEYHHFCTTFSWLIGPVYSAFLAHPFFLRSLSHLKLLCILRSLVLDLYRVGKKGGRKKETNQVRVCKPRRRPDFIISCPTTEEQANYTQLSVKIGSIFRNMRFCILPHLEYCVRLWYPAAEHENWSLILRIESVQRRFTRMIEEVGLLPYSERLRILQLTTLAERLSRGDLSEVYKANKGFSQLVGVLNFSISGSNLIYKPGKSKSAKITRIRRNFINERVMLSWNKLPSDVKNSDSLDIFKRNLEMFKSKTRALGISGYGNYWEISDEVLNRIEAGSYLENKMRHNEYLKDNPLAARKKSINLH